MNRLDWEKALFSGAQADFKVTHPYAVWELTICFLPLYGVHST